MNRIEVNSCVHKPFRNQSNNYYSGHLFYINQIEAFFDRQPNSLKKILSCMFYKSDEDFICRVSMETLANFSGVKKNQARRMVNRLKENNLIQVIKGGRSAKFNTEDKTKNRAQTFEISSIFRDKILANKLRHMPGFYKEYPAIHDLQVEKEPISISAARHGCDLEGTLYYIKGYKELCFRLTETSKHSSLEIASQNDYTLAPYWFHNFKIPSDVENDDPFSNREEIYKLFDVESNITDTGMSMGMNEELTEAELEIIKSFDPKVIQHVKNKLRCHPELKTNGKWIIKACVERCLQLQISIPDLLREYGFDYCADKIIKNSASEKIYESSSEALLKTKTLSRTKPDPDLPPFWRDMQVNGEALYQQRIKDKDAK